MIKRNKYFEKNYLLAFGIVMVSSFAVLFSVSFESQFAIAQDIQSTMEGNEMMPMNQTDGQDKNMMMDMKAMMDMMKDMMNMMNMMMNMMNMSSDMSNSTDMDMSIPMSHNQSDGGADNMSKMMMMPQ